MPEDKKQDEAEDQGQPSTDPTIHYTDVDQNAVGMPTEGPAAIEAGTESEEGRELRERREAEAEELADKTPEELAEMRQAELEESEKARR